MRNFRPVSITDDPPPLSDEWVGLVMETPEQLASRVSLEAERVFDDFDYFSFVGLEIDGCRLGLKRYRGDKGSWSVIHVAPGTVRTYEEIRTLLCKAFNLEPDKFRSKEEANAL